MKYVLFTKLNVLSKPSISAKTCLSVGQNTVAMGDLVRTVLLGCWDDSYINFLCRRTGRSSRLDQSQGNHGGPVASPDPD